MSRTALVHGAQRLLPCAGMCRLVLLMGISLVAAACTGDGGDDSDGGTVGGERTLEIGQGDDEGQGCTPLVDGGDAQLHYGSQGGFHIFFAAQVMGFDERRLVFDIRAYRDDLPGDIPANQMQRALDLEPLGPDGMLVTTQADRLILCPNPAGIGSVDKPYRLWVTVRDSFGHTAHDEVSVTTVCPAGDERCPPTCAGD